MKKTKTKKRASCTGNAAEMTSFEKSNSDCSGDNGNVTTLPVNQCAFLTPYSIGTTELTVFAKVKYKIYVFFFFGLFCFVFEKLYINMLFVSKKKKTTKYVCVCLSKIV